MKLKIYISGAITSDKNYKEHFQKAEDFLNVYDDYKIINPVKIVPEGSSYQEAMKICLYALLESDVIFLLTNYKQSEGTLTEMAVAKSIGLQFWYE